MFRGAANVVFGPRNVRKPKDVTTHGSEAGRATSWSLPFLHMTACLTAQLVHTHATFPETPDDECCLRATGTLDQIAR